MSTLHGNFKKELRRMAEDLRDPTFKLKDLPSTTNMPETTPESKAAEHAKLIEDFHYQPYTAETFAPTPEFCANLAEDERLDFLIRMKHNMSEYFDNTAYANPYGMTNFDYKSIGPSRQQCLEDYKMKVRRENYIYLSQHPEIDAMIEVLLRKMIKSKPEDPVKYAAEYFCVKQTSHEEHEKTILEERERIVHYRKSKSKEFYVPKPDPLATVRKLNLGPLADILEWSKAEEGKAPEANEKAKEEETKPIKKKCCCRCKPMNKGPEMEILPPNNDEEGDEEEGEEQEEGAEEGGGGVSVQETFAALRDEQILEGAQTIPFENDSEEEEEEEEEEDEN